MDTAFALLRETLYEEYLLQIETAGRETAQDATIVRTWGAAMLRPYNIEVKQREAILATAGASLRKASHQTSRQDAAVGGASPAPTTLQRR
jgi:hypothetical protein